MDSALTNPLDEQIAGTHYKQLRIQPVEFITYNKIPFLEGCVIKRMCRHQSKAGLEDLKKGHPRNPTDCQADLRNRNLTLRNRAFRWQAGSLLIPTFVIWRNENVQCCFQ